MEVEYTLGSSFTVGLDDVKSIWLETFLDQPGKCGCCHRYPFCGFFIKIPDVWNMSSRYHQKVA